MEKPGVPRRLSEAGIKQRRMAGIKHGRKAEVVTPEEVLRYRLEKFDVDAPDLINRYVEAQAGDLSVLDRQVAAGLASTEILRRKTVERIAERGVDLEETILNAEGTIVGRRVKANPLLDHLKWMGEAQGYTAKQARLTRESRPDGALAGRINAALARDQRLRAADKTRLPAPDPGLFRETAEELTRFQERARDDPIYRARLAAADAAYRGEGDPDGKPSLK